MKKIQVIIEKDDDFDRAGYLHNMAAGKNKQFVEYLTVSGYLFIILVILFIMVMELKINYSTDFFDNFGTPFDEAYRMLSH